MAKLSSRAVFPFNYVCVCYMQVPTRLEESIVSLGTGVIDCSELPDVGAKNTKFMSTGKTARVLNHWAASPSGLNWFGMKVVLGRSAAIPGYHITVLPVVFC